MEKQLVSAAEGQQARQQVTSSIAYALAESQAPNEEIRASLTPADRQLFEIAERHLLDELRPAGFKSEATEEITIALGRQIGLMRPNLSETQKEEWITLCLDELAQLPAGMVKDALAQVRRTAKFEGEVVPGVIELVEGRALRLKNELKLIGQLKAIAG